MKQFGRREFLRMAGMTTTAALLAACAPSQAPQAEATPTAPQAEAPTAAPAPAEKAALLVWDGFQSESSVVDELVKMFNEANPDIEVKREAQPNMRDILKTSLDGGVGPDVLYYDTGPGFAGVLARANLLLPLDEAYAQFDWKKRIFSIARERTTFDNKIYGIGHELEFIGVFYNQRIFKEHNLSEPKSHEEFMDLCDKLKEANLIPLAFADKDKWPAGHMLSVFGGYIAGKDKLASAISGEVAWNDPDFVEAIQLFFVDMNQAGYFIPEVNAVTYDDANLLFYSGKAAMNLTGTWMVGDYTNQDSMPDPVGFFFYPPIHDKPIAPPAGLGSGYFVSKATTNPQAAFRFLDFLFSEKAAKLWIEGASKIPPIAVNADDYSIPDLFRFVITNLQKNAELMGFNIDVLTPDNFNTMMFDGFQEVLAGTKTAQEQADALENAMAEARKAGTVMDVTP
jgi:raffinose/stachyose/melibiose transport system substrate-binding protein